MQLTAIIYLPQSELLQTNAPKGITAHYEGINPREGETR